MTSFDFKTLSLHDKIEKLYHDGVFIGKRTLEDRISVLYQVDSFYVEIMYGKYRYFIRAINVFRNIQKLDPYLHQMNVRELISG